MSGSNTNQNSGNIKSDSKPIIEKRRTIRLKRSGLLRSKLDDIDRPALKLADNINELKQAFELVYQEYLRSGYIPEPIPSQILFSVYHLLSETSVFVAKSYLDVISTLTLVFDTELFGLPMDQLYQKELDNLRQSDRKIAEVTALATFKSLRYRNLFMYLCTTMFWYARFRKVNDICITVNPKHVEFYKAIFLFDQFGPEKHYPKVDAPAVPLRLNMDDIRGKVKKTYATLDFDCNLYDYFKRMRLGTKQRDSRDIAETDVLRDANRKAMDLEAATYFLNANPGVIEGIPAAQKTYLKSLYPGLNI